MAFVHRSPSRYAIPICLALLLAGCNLRKPHFAGSVANRGVLRDYVDLGAGDRIRVVTPVLKSGGYKPEIRAARAENGVIAFTATDDFVGYETSYYAVKGRKSGGIRIDFSSAWVTKQNRTTRSSHPLVLLFDFPDAVRFVRVIYTVRVSQADHDMAIVAANDLRQLNDLTERLRTAPAEACRVELPSLCEWVPHGIGIQTEEGK